MNTITDDALLLARQAGGSVELEPVDLSTFAGRCWELVETDGVRLETHDSFAMRADPDRLPNLFENLFRNAAEHGSTSPPSQAHEDSVEHSSTGSRATDEEEVSSDATVRVGPLDGGFFVEDDGPGILESEHERVFEPG